LEVADASRRHVGYHQHFRVAGSCRAKPVRHARIEMGGVSGIERVRIMVENQVEGARKHIQQFLAVVLRQRRFPAPSRHRNMHRA
jgi:hypothetical protein